MPDLGQAVLLAVVGGAVGLLVAVPFLRPRDQADGAPDPEVDALALRRRIAYDALLDLEADLRSGSLTPAQYRVMRLEAEARAASTLAALEQHSSAVAPRAAPVTPAGDRRGARLAAGVGAVLAAALVAGFLLPEPFSLANGTVVDRELAAAIAAEDERQAAIDALEARLRDDPGDAAALSELADAYLAGGTRDDLFAAAVALLALIDLQPDNEQAYARLIGAYVRAGDYQNAAAANESFARLAPESPDVAFFKGLIALRGTGDRDAAVRAFDRFLALAPEDGRAPMVRSLRAEAAGELPPDGDEAAP